jgi:predicted ArsR family transcriptional regulator
MDPQTLAPQIAGLAALEEPARRALYCYVVNRHAEVGRDEAAQAVGVSRTLAGFHLDRLVEEGLLDTSFRRLSGRAGPGAGRPAKLYRRSDRQLEVALPERRYELAARMLAEAVELGGPPATRALTAVARQIGTELGAEARARAGKRAGRKRLLAGTVAALAARGYEPEQAGDEIRLRNCPFHALAGRHRALVCGMNLDLMKGAVGAVGCPGIVAVLDPQPGQCCVALKVGKR